MENPRNNDFLKDFVPNDPILHHIGHRLQCFHFSQNVQINYDLIELA